MKNLQTLKGLPPGFGGAGYGQGRKSVSGVGAGKSPVLRVVVSQAQKDKVARLGGAVWVRKMIDAA